jgi:hypothetical protein
MKIDDLGDLPVRETFEIEVVDPILELPRFSSSSHALTSPDNYYERVPGTLSVRIMAKNKPARAPRGNLSLFKTNMETEPTLVDLSRSGFGVVEPSEQDYRAFWTVAFDRDCNAEAQIYETGYVQLRWATLEDETTAKRILSRYARTRGGQPLQLTDYVGHGSKKEAADDLMLLYASTLVDNFNLEETIGILSRDMVSLAKIGKPPEYLDSLPALPGSLRRLRQENLLAPVSGVAVQTVDPRRRNGKWFSVENLPIPTGAFARTLREAATSLRDLVQDPTRVSEQIRKHPVDDFQSMIRHGVLRNFEKHTKRVS